MSIETLYTKYFIILITLLNNYASTSLLSRFRNRQEYVPNADLEMIKNLDDKTYEDLMNEIPILRQVFSGNRKDGSFRFNMSALPFLNKGSEMIRSPESETTDSVEVASYTKQDPAINNNNSAFDLTTTMKYRTHWPAFTTKPTGTLPARRAWYHIHFTEYWHITYPYIISCYWCGLNETLIPSNSMCHDIFDSDDLSSRDLARFLRARCHYYDIWRYYDRQVRMYRWYPHYVEWKYDLGLKLNMFGPYMKGCFKRFVDVGPLYTARGCRGKFQPWRSYTRNFATHRLEKLEIVARGHDDVCVHSPTASLTPFSRAISLYIRYHVCVCPTSYCNSADLHVGSYLFLIITLLVVKYIC